MSTLNEKMDYQECEKFTNNGYFTIRRTDKFWSGMTIERVLMRPMNYGGLTRGRGVSDSVLTRWIVGMLCLKRVNGLVKVFAGVRSQTTEQHADLSPSPVDRDNLDIKKLPQAN